MKYNLRDIKLGIVSKPGKVKKPIAKMSAKRKKDKPVYKKIVAEKIKESNGLCVLNRPTCSRMAQGGDHTQKRSPKNYIDPGNIKPACNNCNSLKERKPELFKDHSISRFKK